MKYAELKAQLRGLINRSDLTDDLAASFIQLAQIRLERVLRTSFMERFVSFNVTTSDGVFRVPIDYIELIDLYSDKGEIERVDMRRWLDTPSVQGIPKRFVQNKHDIRMRPYPAPADTLYLRYYGSESLLTNDEDQNHWTVSCADALLYGAAEYAADHFEDDRLARFSQRFDTAVTEIREQQIDEDFSGPMSLGHTYSYGDE
jgi:hypothetical protein